jgi:dienelactone hydrolase
MNITTPYQHNQKLLAKITPAMRYDGSEPFKDWQLRATEKLNDLLGLPFIKCDDKLSVEYTKDKEDFTEIRFYFQSEEGYFVPCHLLIPKGAEGPVPVTICLQGHSTGMHISLGRPKYENDEETIKGGDRDFAIRAIKEGYCALVIEQRNFGECGGNEQGPDCYNSSMTALLTGRTTIGERVWDVQRAIDVLEKHFPQVDTNEIICMGNSGGGTAAFYAGCLEPRIKYCMPSCAVCTYEDSIAAMRHCSCNYVPNIRKYFEMGDLAGLIAPRYFVLVCGKDDKIFPLHGVEKTFELTKSLYKAAGAEDRCALVIGDEGHRFYADQAWPVMNQYVEA